MADSAAGLHPDAQRIAEQVAERMMMVDRAARGLGIHVVAISPGRAVLRMVIRRHMLNGHGMGHGGMTFSLADTALAYASNSYNQNTVAHTTQITFLAPSREADVLTATAEETAVVGRSGIYDVRVTNQRGETIAVFRGMAQTIKGQPVPEMPVTRPM
ncbi:MAG: hydroxyphenylacetyl-CoA thioesterase PaaI [Pseudomonadota bacterium]|nr:hydroxyphenylacetyl-CoA thioesterase PaaI [Pseudomonadota bacterium]